MSLQENEVVDRIISSLKECIDASTRLAVLSLRGREYERLRSHLALVEGACRQLAVFREDYRWLDFGMKMHVCHQLAGNWLRGYSKNGVYIVWSAGHMNEMFVKLAAELTVILNALSKMMIQRTGTFGPLLPKPPAEERKVGRPAFDVRPKYQRAPLIVPPKYRQRTA